MGRRMVEKLGNGISHFVQAGPIQIAENDALLRFVLRGFDQAHLLIEIFPGLAVENQAIDQGPELRIHGLRKIVLPPEIKRKIGIEMRENNARQKFHAWSFKQKGNLLGTDLFAACTAEVAMSVDPCLDPVFFRISVRPDQQSAAGVVLGDAGHQLGVLFERARLFAVNREINQRCPRHRAFALLPEFFQLAADVLNLD